MNKTQLKKLFKDTDFVHFSGTDEELKAANILKDRCEALGVKAEIESFRVAMGDVKEAHVWIDGTEIPCEGFMCCGSGEIEGELYYMPGDDKVSLDKAKDKIVLKDGIGVGRLAYQDLMKAGVKGCLFTYGNVRYDNHDIDKRDLREYTVGDERKVLCAMLNIKDVVKFLKKGAENARISIDQKEYDGLSHNVIADLPGERPEYIVLSAHYDSTSLSHGAYDNMSGCAGLLAVMEYFTKHTHSYGLRFIFCGSEERGLLGSKAYLRDHESEIENIVLDINLDMIGCPMGSFVAAVTAEDKLVHYIEYLAAENGFELNAKNCVWSSDSTSFADKGIPSLSMSRYTNAGYGQFHCRYDVYDILSMDQLLKDISFITLFTDHMANAAVCPVSRDIPEKIKTEIDEYMARKKKDK